MEVQDSQESSPVLKLAKIEEPSKCIYQNEEKPASIVQSIEIWNRIRYGHVSTAMRLRSLLLFISSTLISFIETISEPKVEKVPATDIIKRIVTSFIDASVEQPRSFSHETFLDILLEKIPNADLKGMHYHETYLAISPMINSVNWARIKFDRRDVKRCYNSLTNILQVCFQQIGFANQAEADQLVLAIYVASVWCSILKQYPELSRPFSDQHDFEAYMKTWVFHPHFENFSKVFVASCCQIMESSDQMKKSEKQSSEIDQRETPKPLSVTASLPEMHDQSGPISSPTISLSPHIHQSLKMRPHFDPYMTYTSSSSGHFAALQQAGMPSLYERRPQFPGVATFSQITSTTPIPLSQSAQSASKIIKRKQPQEQILIAKFDQLARTVSKPRHRKGPKPGTKYRQRITEEASMILQVEAEKVAMSPPDRHSKRKISERTNISLYQVKSFFNRITAERRRIRLGTSSKRNETKRKGKLTDS